MAWKRQISGFFFLFFLAVLGPRCCTRAFSSCSERGLLSRCGVWASPCSGFPCCRAQALGGVGSVVVGHGFSCSVAWKDLPGPGSEPVSPALAGGFLTTGPLGRSPRSQFWMNQFKGGKKLSKKEYSRWCDRTIYSKYLLFLATRCTP